MPTDLGHQTVQRIVHASDPLQSMQDINQNFPSIVSYLSRMKVNNFVTFVCCSYIRHFSPKLLSNILVELWCTKAWWFCSRWNNCKPADDPTWQVFNGSQWCFTQCWRYWPLSVIIFSPDIVYIITTKYFFVLLLIVCTCIVAWGYCCSIISSIRNNCYCIFTVLCYEH